MSINVLLILLTNCLSMSIIDIKPLHKETIINVVVTLSNLQLRKSLCCTASYPTEAEAGVHSHIHALPHIQCWHAAVAWPFC